MDIYKDFHLCHEHLEVKQSNIPNSGKGLFAKVDFAANQRIVPYVGEFKTYDISSQYENDHAHNDHRYCFEYKLGHCIDGQNEQISSWGRFVNDAHKSEFKNNSRFVLSFKGKIPQVWIVAKRPIKAGEEIFVSYGRSYWTQPKS